MPTAGRHGVSGCAAPGSAQRGVPPPKSKWAGRVSAHPKGPHLLRTKIQRWQVANGWSPCSSRPPRSAFYGEDLDRGDGESEGTPRQWPISSAAGRASGPKDSARSPRPARAPLTCTAARREAQPLPSSVEDHVEALHHRGSDHQRVRGRGNAESVAFVIQARHHHGLNVELCV